MCFLLPTVLSIILRRLLIYGVAARQCAKNRLPSVAAGRIQRNRAGVSWHTTLVTKSSVLYLCEGEGGTDRLRAPISAVKTVEQKLADGASYTRLPAFCPLRSKGIQNPAAAAVLFLCAFSSLAGSTFEQIRFLADFHQPALFVVGQFAIVDLILLTEQHHQLFDLAALDLRDFL